MNPNKAEIPAQLKDFKNVLWVIWKHLNLPDPTPLQYDLADVLQGDEKRVVIQAFRGCGKSWLTSAFVIWNLLLDPSKNFLVVSASKTRSDDFSSFCLKLIHEIPLFAHLKPSDGQRFSKISFDVGGAPASHAPSVKSLGISSQLTGSRANVIIFDDCEVVNNSATMLMREKLSEQVKEADAILVPDDPEAKIIFLGTPQTHDSIYTKLTERGYKRFIWPAEHITPAHNDRVYDGDVRPICVNAEKEGKSTEPLRFSDIDLSERKISYGSAGYAMQFLLDSKLSDVEKFPLKISDLIVTTVNKELAPEKYVWARDPDLEWDSSVRSIWTRSSTALAMFRARTTRSPSIRLLLIHVVLLPVLLSPSGASRASWRRCSPSRRRGRMFDPRDQSGDEAFAAFRARASSTSGGTRPPTESVSVSQMSKEERVRRLREMDPCSVCHKKHFGPTGPGKCRLGRASPRPIGRGLLFGTPYVIFDDLLPSGTKDFVPCGSQGLTGKISYPRCFDFLS